MSLLIVILLTPSLFSRIFGKDLRRCEEIQIPFCQGMRYNHTRMPNLFNHQHQEEAELEVIQFKPLVDIQCSPDIKFFLCGLYTPICLRTYPNSVPVCRSVCERVKRACFPIMKQYGFDWPPKMDCESLPRKGSELCMDPSDRVEKPNERRKKQGDEGLKNEENCGQCSTRGLVRLTDDDDDLPFLYSFGGIPECASSCRSPHFDERQLYVLEMFLSTASIVCLIASCLTLFTFAVDSERFDYPSRPIMYISYCYIMVAIGFVIRLSVGHEYSSCRRSFEGSFYSVNGLRNNNDDLTCAFIFILVYYFGMAGNIWWVILTVSWFLSSGLKWAPEAILNISRWFHLATWTIPLLKTITIFFMNAIDGDPVSGICYVGSQNRYTLMVFVIIPLMIYLSVSFYFLFRGTYSLYRIYGSLPHDQVLNFRKLLARIAVFSISFVTPLVIVWSCSVYELWFTDLWEEKIVNCTTISDRDSPRLTVFYLKYVMMLAPGIATVTWICSEKTIDISWQKFGWFKMFRKTVVT